MLVRNILLVIGGGAFLLGMALMVMWFRQSTVPDTTAASHALATEDILIATRAIPAGTLVRGQDMAWRSMPVDAAVGADIIRGQGNEAEFVGSVTRRAFAAQAPFAADAFIKPGDRDFLVATLAPGYRAVSIAVDATQSNFGLMQPGDRVDVVLTQSFSPQAAGAAGPDNADLGRRTVSETVLRDLRIIAVDQALTVAAAPMINIAGSDPKLPKTITLEVRESEAEKLMIASQLGKIQLTLRGDQSPEAAPLHPRPPTWAFNVSPALDSLAAPPPAAARGTGAITVFRGAKAERVCPTAAGYAACP